MKTVVLLSGGVDSTTLLYQLVNEVEAVRAISFNYGQRHFCELASAKIVAEFAQVPHCVVDMKHLAAALPGSSQTDKDVKVPHGRYDEESMKATVVPNRNMILMSVAIGHAIAHKFDSVAYAAHAGDHAIYPDCRTEFVEAMAVAASLCDWQPIQIIRPYVGMKKSDIVKRGDALGVNWTLTWSCYEGGNVHCGKCGTCIERREAFYVAGVPDPTLYSITAPAIEEMVANDWHLKKAGT